MMAKTENSRWIRGDQIGKGSFGTVSLGFDRCTGRIFAVKSVPANSRFSMDKEISILRSLSSPFIVQYYGDDSDAEQRNLHMEYVSGGTAAEFARSGGDEGILRRYMWCLVSALEYIHSKGIVHCDVKGKNVLVDRGSCRAKLGDFGCAKWIDGDGSVGSGSPLWMAPEVIRGESQGKEADVWAVGCTLIEMVTGGPAWSDEGGKTLCRIGNSEELPRFPGGLSGLGRDFLDKCLRRDPSRRWSCDRLLRHGFLRLGLEWTVQIECEPSPRSVIEWPRLEEEWHVSDDEEARGRVGELVGESGVNWESDGWVQVRRMEDECVGCFTGKWNEEHQICTPPTKFTLPPPPSHLTPHLLSIFDYYAIQPTSSNHIMHMPFFIYVRTIIISSNFQLSITSYSF